MIAAIPDHKTEKCGEWLGWQRVAFKVKRFLCYVRLCYDRMTCQLWKKKYSAATSHLYVWNCQ